MVKRLYEIKYELTTHHRLDQTSTRRLQKKSKTGMPMWIIDMDYIRQHASVLYRRFSCFGEAKVLIFIADLCSYDQVIRRSSAIYNMCGSDWNYLTSLSVTAKRIVCMSRSQGFTHCVMFDGLGMHTSFFTKYHPNFFGWAVVKIGYDRCSCLMIGNMCIVFINRKSINIASLLLVRRMYSS